MEILKINTPLQAFSSALLSKFLLCPLTFLLIAASQLKADEPKLPEGITVDLRHPDFSEGVLKTKDGGVVSCEGIRLQAQKILYQRKISEGKAVCHLEAEGDLLIEYGDNIFIGERAEYNFLTKTGVIYRGKTALEPWFFGGDKIFLNADKSYTIENSFLTTSENSIMDWQLTARQATLYDNHDLEAYDFKFQYHRVPLFWLPRLKVNLDFIRDFPIRYSARWGGRQGPRVEFLYEIFSWKRWKTFVKFDYRLTRGPGLGIETYYRSEDHKETFEAINYVARDSSLSNPHERTRYRFQGVYNNTFFDDKVTLDVTYDKLSDKDMATDYSDSGLNLQYPGATALRLRRQADSWIANLRTTVRLNTFQTIKQELPTLEISWKPVNLGNTKIIASQIFKASYLDFQYADHINRQNDYHSRRFHEYIPAKYKKYNSPYYQDYNSPRVQYIQQLYRTFRISSLIVTPELGGTLIYYGNLPKDNDRWLLLGNFKVDTKMPFYKSYSSLNHVMTPYARYEYYTMPTSTPRAHYIFDINDGLYELNMLRFGVQHDLYFKTGRELINRPLRLDIFANAFFDSKTYHKMIPKVYGVLDYYLTPRIRYTVSTAWDFEHSLLDHFNLRSLWTLSANLAFAAEYRHRDDYDFRKADRTNFMLDAYKSPHRLLHTPLSDRRDTFLLDFFYRFHPLWALEVQSRFGWNRKWQPGYSEFEIDLLGKPYASWQVKFSYQHSENDKHRFTVYFNMGNILPDKWKCDHLIPKAEF